MMTRTLLSENDRVWSAAPQSDPEVILQLEIGIAIHRKNGAFTFHFVTPNNGSFTTTKALELPIPPGVLVRFRLNFHPTGTKPKGELFDPETRVSGDSPEIMGSVYDPKTQKNYAVTVKPQPARVLEVEIHDALSPQSMTFREKEPAPLGLYIAQLNFQENSPLLQSFYLLPNTSVRLTFDEPEDMTIQFADTPITFDIEPQPDWLQFKLPAHRKSLTLANTGQSAIESAVPAVVHASGSPREGNQRVPIQIDPTVVNRGSMTDMKEPPDESAVQPSSS